MPRDIYSNKDLIARIPEIGDREEHRYSDIPHWTGEYVAEGPAAVMLCFKDRPDLWLPISQLRRAQDGQSIYASKWIIEQKDLT